MVISNQQYESYTIDDVMRSGDQVMVPERLGAFRMTSISFARSVLRKIVQDGWRISKERFEIDEEGFGEAVYGISTPKGRFSFIIFSEDLGEYERSDRVISEKWDMTFALCEGELTDEKIDSLRSELPKQEFGRGDVQDLVWSRANRSSRIFNYILNALTKGEQPDPHEIAKVGYILRSTAFYANGKFGIAPFDKMREDHPFRGAFRAQLFTAYMLRQFSLDIVEHIAKLRNPSSARLNTEIKRFIGIGNATGLGMVPFLIYHPKLIHQLIHLRELALARSSVSHIGKGKVERLKQLLEQSITYFRNYPSINGDAFASGEVIAHELDQVKGYLQNWLSTGYFSSDNREEIEQWYGFIKLVYPNLSKETQEAFNTLLIEIYPEKNIELEDYTVVNEEMNFDPKMTIEELLSIIENQYHWAFQFDFSHNEENFYYWYRSVEKEEPRIGERQGKSEGEKYSMPVDIAFQVQQVTKLLIQNDKRETLGRFVLKYPQSKGIIRRIQALDGYEYSEIRGNLRGKNLLPLYLMRCKLSMLGAERFDPKSNQWVRVTFFQGAPLIEDIHKAENELWIFPSMPELEESQ